MAHVLGKVAGSAHPVAVAKQGAVPVTLLENSAVDHAVLPKIHPSLCQRFAEIITHPLSQTGTSYPDIACLMATVNSQQDRAAKCLWRTV